MGTRDVLRIGGWRPKMNPKKTHVCPICGKGFTSKQGLEQHMRVKHPNGTANVAKRKRERKSKGKDAVTNPSTIVLSLVEPLPNAKGVGAHVFLPGASGLPRLDAMGRIYEQWCLEHLRYELIPTVGTTVSGTYTAAVDYDASDIITAPEGLSNCSPRIVKPLWQGGSITVPPKDAMKSRWHFTMPTSGGGFTASHAFYLSADEDKNPKVSVHYSIRFKGPAPFTVATPFSVGSDKKWYDEKGKEVESVKLTANSSVPFEYNGPSTWWDTFSKGLGNVSIAIDNTVQSWRRITGIMYPIVSSVALAETGVVAGQYLALRGRR
nr:TPA_asm: hypothetical protein [Candastroli virus 3]